MLEFLLFALGLGLDQFVKLLAMQNLVEHVPVQITAFLQLQLEFNDGKQVSFFRSTHPLMYVFRLAQALLALYILIRLRKKISRWTRAGLALFLAGLVGNQVNYLIMGRVPDMFYMPDVIHGIFNVADLLVMVSMVILFIRLAFFEGTQLVEWALKKLGIKTGKPPAGKEPTEERNE